MPFHFEGWGFQVNFDGIFIVFCLVAGLDWFFGVALAIINRKLLSKSMFRGILKKIGIVLLVIIVDMICDVTIKDNGVIRYGLIVMLISYELTSFLEHLKLSGVKVPPIIGKLLDHLQVEAQKNLENRQHNKELKKEEEHSDEQN